MNYVVCEYCEFVTTNQKSMDKHNKTDKHDRNINKGYISLSCKSEIIDKYLKKSQKRTSSTDFDQSEIKTITKQNFKLF